MALMNPHRSSLGKDQCLFLHDPTCSVTSRSLAHTSKIIKHDGQSARSINNNKNKSKTMIIKIRECYYIVRIKRVLG